jgi:hypothetical protein
MSARSDNAKIQNGQNPKDFHPFEATDLSKIKDLVQRFQVCWEVYPEQVLTTGEIRKVGFSLELYGTHEPDTEHVSPGCEHCRPVQAALREIAQWILPREKRPSMYEVSVETQALSYSRERGNRPDVRVTIRILHRTDFEKPVDECEVRCLKEMEQALGDIGACKSVWRPARQVPPQQ